MHEADIDHHRPGNISKKRRANIGGDSVASGGDGAQGP